MSFGAKDKLEFLQLKLVTFYYTIIIHIPLNRHLKILSCILTNFLLRKQNVISSYKAAN
jgi:hypothetical protein